ncbi:MAG: EF-hand domain-containing protein [Alphaproteobacteria bacterium]
MVNLKDDFKDWLIKQGLSVYMLHSILSEKKMKRLLLFASVTVLFPLSASAQSDQSLYAKPIVNQVVEQPDMKKLYSDVFNIQDVNNDKFISENEFSYLVNAVDAEMNFTEQEKNDKKACLLKTFAEVDTNKDNKLDRDEFRNFMVAETQFEAQDRLNTMSKIMNAPDPETEMEKRMEQSLAQLKKATEDMKKISPQDMADSLIDNISNSIIEENFFQMDKDKKGCATKDEFVTYMRQYQKNQREKLPDIFKEEYLMSEEELGNWFDSIDKKNENCLTKEEYAQGFLGDI